MNKIIALKSLFILLVMSSLFISCKDDVLPKPKSQLRLEYPMPEYSIYSSSCPFLFEKNTTGIVKQDANCGFSITYPKMKATIYLTYKPVSGNLNNLLRDAQKLTYEHVIKADDIIEQPFVNTNKKVYGMFYQVGGNAATNAQFYVTDSLKHFVTGSIYFYAKPNFDSIMPATSYIKNDMRTIMESFEWK
jgi:gliding motility-associated lipoprotein GldD